MNYIHYPKSLLLLSDDELMDLKGFINTIITHITNGNKNEERLVNVMGGTVIETESKRLRREGREEGIEQGIRSLMKTMKLNLNQAMDALNIPAEEQSMYADRIRQR